VSQSLFPLDDAENYLRKFIPSLEHSAGALRWSSDDGISELSLTPIHEQTFDGLTVSEVVTLTHTSPFLADLVWTPLPALTPGRRSVPLFPQTIPAQLDWLQRWGYSTLTELPLSGVRASPVH
jgi:hypothetical protein